MKDSDMSSRSRVFATSELFELILLKLPMRDLLLASQISKTFHATITTSPALQYALFFRPINGSPPQADIPNLEINPLLDVTFPGFLSDAPEIPIEEWDLHFNRFPNPPEPYDSSSTALYLCSAWSLRPEAFARKEASWRRMLVCQPPVRRLTLINKFDGEGGTSVDEGSLDFEEGEGLRMHTLADYLYGNVAARPFFRPTFLTRTRWGEVEYDAAACKEQRRLTLWLKVNGYVSCIPQVEEKLDLYRSEGYEKVWIPVVEKLRPDTG
ncbi:uncharacterized protein BDZ99DRAFT_115998 [Mytilinidion resinicola]|uniref:F-box domain-containing protein n=1 Tax=Mytilinidion resinicola TaxID=574789 RepID=A0A6A6Y9K0_9PEZI|nr:uncharacterized protein BDZ99DRAFT_115998 [Mytilinidion resinicola]KAF2805238.1 hypothetical protein BDZ99DRAFT_115998 [Mytilinidion resinicola]